jgi:hypothetical protein
MRDSQTRELHFINGVNVQFKDSFRPYINPNGQLSYRTDRNTYEVMKIEFDTDLVYFTLSRINRNEQYVSITVPIPDPRPGNFLIIV